jgi:hypothetical protein
MMIEHRFHFRVEMSRKSDLARPNVRVKSVCRLGDVLESST